MISTLQNLINPFQPNGISHRNQLEQFISVLGESDLGLHCFSMSHKKDARLI